MGFLSWGLFSFLRLPAAALLGPAVIIGTLRVLNIPLVSSPDFFPIIIQVVIGYIVGSKITRDKIKELKTMITPVGIIITWAISIIFILGFILIRFTNLDTYTAFLASSMGGLAEMTLVSIAVGAETSVVVIIHTIRVLVTLAIFPILANNFESEGGLELVNSDKEFNQRENNKIKMVTSSLSDESIELVGNNNLIKDFFLKILNVKRLPLSKILISGIKVILILCLGAVGGFFVLSLGVPAGAMVGSMLTISIISLMGIKIKTLSSSIANLLLVGVGIMVSDNITLQTVKMIISGRFILIILLSTFFIFLSSFLVAHLLKRITEWDKLTCFLSAAPGGFTVLASLAIKYKKDLFVISILHLCRLVIIKILVPIIFALIT